MTREEAIKHLETYSTTNGSGQTSQAQHEEAKRMGIKALEQEPCEDWHDIPSNEMNLEQARQAVRDLRKFVMDNHILPKLQPCEDAISRQAVIDTIHKTIYQFFDVCDDDEEVPISDKDELLLTINKAICNNLKALAQEPEHLVNESGDLVKDLVKDTISRQAVLDLLVKYDNDMEFDVYSEIFYNIDKLPSVTPQHTDAEIQ